MRDGRETADGVERGFQSAGVPGNTCYWRHQESDSRESWF